MSNIYLAIVCFSLLAQTGFTEGSRHPAYLLAQNAITQQDTVEKSTILNIVNTVINASSTFNLEAVANLYAPNAVVADEEPPFSWNGPTAGIQWVSTVEKTVKDNNLKGFKGKIKNVRIFLQSDESVYIVVPVDYSGEIKGDHFEEDGAFTFILRVVSGKWLIKSQVWVARKGL